MVWVENMSFLHHVLTLLGSWKFWIHEALSGETWLSENEEIKLGEDTAGLGGRELNGEEEALDVGVDVCARLFVAHDELVLLSSQTDDELLGVDGFSKGT